MNSSARRWNIQAKVNQTDVNDVDDQMIHPVEETFK